MIFYWLFLCLAPFQSHPVLGATLFQAGFMPITPIKLAGVLAVGAAVLGPRPAGAAPKLGTAISPIFAMFATYPLFTTILFGRGIPSISISALLSFAMLLIATRSLICTQQRLLGTIRVLVFSEAVGSLWLYKQYYIQGWDVPVGPSSDANYEALAIVMVLPLAIYLVRSDPSRLSRLIALASAPLLFFAVIVAQSRGGMLALGIIALAAWQRSRRKALTLAGFAIALVLAMALGPSVTWERFHQIKVSGDAETGAEVSTRTRIELWRGGLAMIRSNPISGVGLDRFKTLVGDYNPKLYSVIDRNYIAHNTYVQLGAEGGLPTLALFIASILVAASNFRRCELKAGRERDLGLIAASMRLGLYSYAVAAFFLTAQFEKALWVYVFVSPNLCEIAGAKVHKDKEDRAAAASLNKADRSESTLANVARVAGASSHLRVGES
jgi:O-antigen ligase